MKLDEAKYAFESLKHRKMRSFLSILSILIGITSIFALASFGLGIQNYITTIASESGTDKLFIQARGVGAPGTDDTFYLTQDDVDFVERITGVSGIAGLYMEVAKVEFNDQTKYNYLMGADMGDIRFVEETFTTKLHSGRRPRDGSLNEVLLGYNYMVANKIFERPVRLGDDITINGVEYDVVGFYESLGNPQDDGSIYTTKEAIEAVFPDTVEQYAFVIIRSEPDVSPELLAERIQERLRDRKGQEEGEEDFFVRHSQTQLPPSRPSLEVINGIIILIALISIIVAAVNIMNTMYTAVLERTGEIGIMKAVGARNSDILFIFIFEASVLGAIGGTIGVALGYLIASAGGAAATAAGFGLLSPIFPQWLIWGCIFFSAIIGGLAGLMPALRASKLRPVEALRYK